MTGNVWEWSNDWYDSEYYSVSPYDNPTGPVSDTYRVLRGGCWNGGHAYYSQIAIRYDLHPGSRGGCIGFRIVLDLN